jgi:hypothetical protein
MHARAALAAALLVALPACAHGGGAAAPGAVPGVAVAMEYAAGADFWAAPFPDESRRRANGTIDLARFPGRAANLLVDEMAAVAARDADGFGLTSGIFFALSAPPDTTAA